MIEQHKNITHGMRKTRLYSIWVGMKTRCLNPNHVWFKHYGGKGVKICEKWMKFEGFRDDMLASYNEHVATNGESDTTLDRVNGDLGYHKENCKWATKKEQSNNARNNINITYQGETKTLYEWAKIFDISYPLMWGRLRRGMPLHDVFSRVDFRKNKRPKP